MRTLVVGEQLRRSVPGGIGTYVRSLVAALGDLDADVLDVDVTVWLSRGRDLNLGVPERHELLPSALATRFWQRGLRRAPSGFDILHAPSFAWPDASAGTTTTMFVHDLVWRRTPESFPKHGYEWHEAALARALRTVDRFAVPSQQTADDLLAAGAADDRVVVLGEGADHLPAPNEAAVDRLDLGKRFLLSVSTLEPRKNLPTLVAAFAQVRRAEPDLELVVVGPAGWGDVDIALSNRDGVRLIGFVPNDVLAALYRRAQALVFVPLVEGFGLPVVEAMNAGCPVVSSPVPSAGDATLVVDPASVDSIAAGITTVVSDAALREQLVAQGIAHVSDSTWHDVAVRHVDFWKESR
jgi:glycosyltransferase involved in cell wall biosynthesis